VNYYLTFKWLKEEKTPAKDSNLYICYSGSNEFFTQNLTQFLSESFSQFTACIRINPAIINNTLSLAQEYGHVFGEAG
jgi:hypothetical protein